MKVRKFHGEEVNAKVTFRVTIDTQRELDLLEALFSNTYKLQEIANKAGEEVYSHAEVKELADAFYIAIVTKKN